MKKNLTTQAELLAPINAAGAMGAMLDLLAMHGDVLPDLSVNDADLDSYTVAVKALFKSVDMQAQYDPNRLPPIYLSPAQQAILTIESIITSVNAGLVDREAFADYLADLAKAARDPDHRETLRKAGLLLLATMLITVDSVQERLAERLTETLLGAGAQMISANSPEGIIEALRDLVGGAPKGTTLN